MSDRDRRFFTGALTVVGSILNLIAILSATGALSVHHRHHFIAAYSIMCVTAAFCLAALIFYATYNIVLP